MISVCMIVKNEEKWIESCLINLKSLADEIIVVDTGSSDRTKEICVRHGVSLYDFEWTKDFSEARNFAIEKATQEWIFSFDADERIPFIEIQKTKDLLSEISDMNEIEAVRITRRDFVEDSNVSNFVPCQGEYPDEERDQLGYYEERMVRIFRNREHIRWQGSLHELIDPSLEGGIFESPVIFHHFGYLKEEVARKDKRKFYQEFGERKIANNPSDWKAHFDHGIEALGAKNLKKAVQFLARAKQLNSKFPVIDSNLGYALMELAKFREAHHILENAVIQFPQHADNHLNLGVLLMRQNRYSEAIARFHQLIRVAPESFLGYRNMALCFAKMKNPARSIECFKKSLSIFPQYMDAKIDMALVYFMAGKAKTAESILSEALKQEPENKKIKSILPQIQKALQNSSEVAAETERA